jgi:hypothetical protein
MIALFHRIWRLVMNGTDERALGTALAGGAIAAATLEALFDKGILSLEESRAVLDKAMMALGPIGSDAVNARRIVASMMAGKFSARG